MKKFFYLPLFFFIFGNIVWALSTLPSNAYLQYKDNQREVKILQQILNSDPDTQITDDGVGSPGQENWYFGALTKDALARFQQKYNLNATGKIDYKTLKQLNIIANGGPVNPAVKPATSDDKTSKNFEIPVDDSKKKEIKQTWEDNVYLQNNAKKPASAAPAKKSIFSSELLQSIIDKYSNYFSPASSPASNASSTIYSNSQTTATPYYNPATGQYQSTPLVPTNNPTQNQTQNPYLNNNNSNPFANTTNNPYLNNNNSGSQGNSGNSSPFTDYFNSGNQQSGPQGGNQQANNKPANQQELDLLNGAPCGALQSSVDTSALVGGNNGGACGIGTNFGNNPNGSNDGDDNGSGCTKSGGGTYNTRKGGDGEEGIALPKDVQIAMFGSLKAACGGWVEVTFVPTGKCQTFRIVDTGPSAFTGAIIDLTGVAENKIGGASRQRYCYKKAANQNQQ